MLTSSLLTIGSLAMQLRAFWKRSLTEPSENFVGTDKVPPDLKKSPKFSTIREAQNVRTFPQLNSPLRLIGVPAVTPEILAALSAALAQQCGTYVAIRSVKKLAPPSAAVSPWTQQGRVQVHASHDFPTLVRQVTRSKGRA